MLADALASLVEGRSLEPPVMQNCMRAIMSGRCQEGEVASFLTALRMKGETPEELAAAASVMREEMVRLDTGNLNVLDTCGTGGDELRTFNISTGAAIVAAACGVPVVKHGNRSVSSSSGSADVLVELGVRVDVDVSVVQRCLGEAGIAFCFAPRFHPAMKHVAPVRRLLRFRTLFNLLGPLCNPAGAPYQLLGVGRESLLDKLAQTLSLLEPRSAYLVCGSDGLDEVTLGGMTHVRHVAGSEIKALKWTPEDFGLAPSGFREVQVATPAESASRLRGVLLGEEGPARNLVLANAAAALLASQKVGTLREGVARSREALRDGKAAAVLAKLVSVSKGTTG